MAASKKSIRMSLSELRRSTVQKSAQGSAKKMIWVFDSVDRDGEFRFMPDREDMNAKDVLDKIIAYSCRTWQEVLQETHDRGGKSKNHYLDYDKISAEGKERIAKLQLEEDTDAVFSLRISNLERIIGIRHDEKFIVKWFDPRHRFCPSSR